ncbi:protein of unknown function [Shewanella benthica]|uniref:Uncharacterized protein n=1 Tax=Shewanella benthica TaxID=43661 RepID=A0A330M2Q8_9GAMM|nr:protein of unknown function [Shewanella benthica]
MSFEITVTGAELECYPITVGGAGHLYECISGSTFELMPLMFY